MGLVTGFFVVAVGICSFAFGGLSLHHQSQQKNITMINMKTSSPSQCNYFFKLSIFSMIFSNAANPKLSLHSAATMDTEVSLKIMLVSLEGQNHVAHLGLSVARVCPSRGMTVASRHLQQWR